MPLKAAVLGLGHLGRHHARILATLPDVELVAICDLDPAKYEQPECPQDVPRVDDPCDAWHRADLVVVATPTLTHAAIAGEALRAGRDVLVEKPLAASPGDGEALLEAARSGGGVLLTGHVERFNGASRALAGRLRLPVFAEGHRLAPFTVRSLDVDVVLDLMVHDLDLLLHTVRDEVQEVHAVGVAVLTPHVDIASARLQFRRGCVANLTSSRVSEAPVRKLRFFDRSAYWSLDFGAQKAEEVRLEAVPGAAPRPLRTAHALQGEPLRLELEDFVEAARARRSGREPQPLGATGTDGLAALQLACRVRAAIEAHAQSHPGTRA